MRFILALLTARERALRTRADANTWTRLTRLPPGHRWPTQRAFFSVSLRHRCLTLLTVTERHLQCVITRSMRMTHNGTKTTGIKCPGNRDTVSFDNWIHYLALWTTNNDKANTHENPTKINSIPCIEYIVHLNRNYAYDTRTDAPNVKYFGNDYIVWFWKRIHFLVLWIINCDKVNTYENLTKINSIPWIEYISDLNWNIYTV